MTSKQQTNKNLFKQLQNQEPSLRQLFIQNAQFSYKRTAAESQQYFSLNFNSICKQFRQYLSADIFCSKQKEIDKYFQKYDSSDLIMDFNEWLISTQSIDLLIHKQKDKQSGCVERKETKDFEDKVCEVKKGVNVNFVSGKGSYNVKLDLFGNINAVGKQEDLKKIKKCGKQVRRDNKIIKGTKIDWKFKQQKNGIKRKQESIQKQSYKSEQKKEIKVMLLPSEGLSKKQTIKNDQLNLSQIDYYQDYKDLPKELLKVLKQGDERQKKLKTLAYMLILPDKLNKLVTLFNLLNTPKRLPIRS